MILWILQMIFNLSMAACAIAWLLSKKQERERTQRSFETREPSLAAALTQSDKPSLPAIETPLGSSLSTLSERQSPELRSSSPAFDAYEKADWMISRRVDLREVARQTGLSLAELQLIGKMAQKSQ